MTAVSAVTASAPAPKAPRHAVIKSVRPSISDRRGARALRRGIEGQEVRPLKLADPVVAKSRSVIPAGKAQANVIAPQSSLLDRTATGLAVAQVLTALGASVSKIVAKRGL